MTDRTNSDSPLEDAARRSRDRAGVASPDGLGEARRTSSDNTPARRWRIGSYRQSDEVRKGRGYVAEGDEFRTYGEHVNVREDIVTDDDIEAARAWLRVNPRQAFTAENVRDLLSMVLGERQ